MQHLDPTFASYRHLLIHQPEKQWRGETELTHHQEFSDKSPIFTIVIPIHNQESFVEIQIQSVFAHTIGRHEIIAILDGCNDKSKENLLGTLKTTPFPKNLTSITVFENQDGMFETSADNLGFTKARGDILIEIQADMEILTTGYNLELALPLKIYPDLIAISGRCCHRVNAKSLGFNIGRLGTLVEKPHQILQHHENHNAIFLSHTVNRGPLALDRKKVADLGYLDERHYCLGNDDHDLFLRAWDHKGWRTGFVPVEFHSPLERGSTRQKRSPKAQATLDQRKQQEENGFYSLHHKQAIYPASQTRRPSPNERIHAMNTLLANSK